MWAAEATADDVKLTLASAEEATGLRGELGLLQGWVTVGFMQPGLRLGS